MQLVRCALGKHQRDRATVVSDGTVHRGLCEGCRTPMFKGQNGWEPEHKQAD